MRVLLHFDADAELRQELVRLAAQGIEVTCCPEWDDTTFYRLLGQTEVLWHNLRPVSGDDIANAPRLRLIQKLGSGVNTVDVAAAAARGVAVANMPGANAQAVAETALLLMLAVLRRLRTLDARTRAGRGWPLDPGLCGGELAGRTVGLVGFGQTARRLADMVTAVGATVRYTTRTADPADPRRRSLEGLLAESDVVSLHVPLTPETRRLIDRGRLALLRPGAILVNTARGDVVDEAALVDALRSGRLAGAGLDVFAVEPVAADNPLLTMDNVVVTPHVAWLTRETLRRYIATAVENCHRLAAGEPLLHRVA